MANTIKERFTKFHQQNPSVYDELVQMSINFRSKGNAGRIGIGMLFEVLRWNRLTTVVKDDRGFKLNNDFRSHYARKIMLEHPEFGDIFQVRIQRAE